MSRHKNWKRCLAAMVVAAALAVPAPALAAGSGWVAGSGHDAGWVVRLLGWLGLSPQGLASALWGADSANIDPDGQPQTTPGGPPGASAGTDSSAHIDPDG